MACDNMTYGQHEYFTLSQCIRLDDYSRSGAYALRSGLCPRELGVPLFLIGPSDPC